MIGWLILATYVVGWFPAAVKATRFVGAHRAYCHQQNGQRWHLREYCRKWDGRDCWRNDPQPGVRDALAGVGLAFIWPVSLLVGAVYFAARGPVAQTASSRLLSEAEIDRMERDLGIGGKS